MNEIIHVLRIRTNISYNDGVTSFARNYYRHIDKSKFKIDFVVHSKPEESLVNEITADGNHVFEFPGLSLKNIRSLNKRAFDLRQKYSYDIVHLNLPNAAFIYLKQAKRAGVKIRIRHCHETKFSDIKSHELRNRFLWLIGKKYVTTCFACSDLAGKFLYKRKNFFEINNGIESNAYVFSQEARDRVRKELNVQPDSYVFGLVGRYCPQKNQLFAIRLFQKEIKNNVIVCLGLQNDEYYDECKKESANYSNIILLDSVKNVSDYYSAFDVLILPSKYEGRPLTLVEAQANGLPCLASATISKEADLGGVSFLPLDSLIWKQKIKDFSLSRKVFVSTKFDIRSQAKRLEFIYLDEVKKYSPRKENDKM